MGQNCAAQAPSGPQPKSCGAVVRVTRNGSSNCVQEHRIAERLRNECAPRGFPCRAHTRRVDSPPRRVPASLTWGIECKLIRGLLQSSARSQSQPSQPGHSPKTASESTTCTYITCFSRLRTCWTWRRKTDNTQHKQSSSPRRRAFIGALCVYRVAKSGSTGVASIHPFRYHARPTGGRPALTGLVYGMVYSARARSV